MCGAFFFGISAHKNPDFFGIAIVQSARKCYDIFYKEPFAKRLFLFNRRIPEGVTAAERLDKLLVRMGCGSRREVVALVRGGKVAVNGDICTENDRKIDPERDKLTVNGEAVAYRAHWYLMMNKPAGVITATEDPRHETVFSLLPERLRRAGVFPVGRLDKDTEGLLLLTTDGDWGHALMSPRRHVPKLYEAAVDSEPAPDAETRFFEGLTLKDGTLCRPAKLERCAPCCVHVTVCEGKYHQVKRMLKAVGSEVTALRRLAVGPLSLDAALAPGAYRELTAEELAALASAQARQSDTGL